MSVRIIAANSPVRSLPALQKNSTGRLVSTDSAAANTQHSTSPDTVSNPPHTTSCVPQPNSVDAAAWVAALLAAATVG